MNSSLLRMIEVTPDSRDPSLVSSRSIRVEETTAGAAKSEWSVEHLQVLIRRERDLYPPSKDLMEGFQGIEENGDHMLLCETWRQKIAEWSYDVVDYFENDREVVAIALNYLDRFAATQSKPPNRPLEKKDYQLIAITSLYMALKTHGECDHASRPKFHIRTFEALSRGRFEPKVILAMERKILDGLDWLLHPPTCIQFLPALFQLFPSAEIAANDHDTESFVHTTKCLERSFDIARYLAELSVCTTEIAFNSKASVIAYSSILCGIEVVKTSHLFFPDHLCQVFYRNVAETVGLRPSNHEVSHASKTMKSCFPNVFDGTISLFHFREDSTHPVASTTPRVVDEPDDRNPRKRPRSET